MLTEWSDSILVSELADEPSLSGELSNLHERYAGGISNPGRAHKHLVLNLSGVTYFSSSHLAQLLRLRKQVADHHRIMILCALTDHVWSVMLLTGLDRVFRFAQDPSSALTAIQLECNENA